MGSRRPPFALAPVEATQVLSNGPHVFQPALSRDLWREAPSIDSDETDPRETLSLHGGHYSKSRRTSDRNQRRRGSRTFVFLVGNEIRCGGRHARYQGVLLQVVERTAGHRRPISMADRIRHF